MRRAEGARRPCQRHPQKLRAQEEQSVYSQPCATQGDAALRGQERVPQTRVPPVRPAPPMPAPDIESDPGNMGPSPLPGPGTDQQGRACQPLCLKAPSGRAGRTARKHKPAFRRGTPRSETWLRFCPSRNPGTEGGWGGRGRQRQPGHPPASVAPGPLLEKALKNWKQTHGQSQWAAGAAEGQLEGGLMEPN